MIRRLSATLSVLAAGAAHADLIELDPPSIPGGGKLIQTWHEAGYTLRGSPSFGHTDSGSSDPLPDNGTAYGQTLFGSAPVVLTEDTGAIFRAVAIDIAEYSTVANNAEFVLFTGLRRDGSSIEVSFELDGIIDGSGPLDDFERFQFPPEFTDLVSLTLETDACSFDNIELVVVPAPASAGALGLGAALVMGSRRRRSHIEHARS